MAIRKGDKVNFETLKRACLANDLTLMECKDKATGEYRAVLCAVGFVDGQYTMTPLGHLCTDNPYEQYVPPDAGVRP